MIKSKKGITAVEVIVIITIIAILAAIIYGVIVDCLNEQNRITEGFIVGKSYTIDVYYNELTCYFTIAKGNNIIYEFYDGDTWDRVVEQIVYTIQKY